MTYGTLNASVPVLRKLVKQNLHLRQAYQLMKIATRANDELLFFNKKYEDIMTGQYSESEKTKMIDELLNFEVDWDLEPVVLDIDDDRLMLSAQDLGVSIGLIEIKENDKGGR